MKAQEVPVEEEPPAEDEAEEEEAKEEEDKAGSSSQEAAPPAANLDFLNDFLSSFDEVEGTEQAEEK